MSCAATPGLSSYPHPWLMPDFWRFPTVSMGIGPLNAIYQARFMRYLENRNLIEKTPRKVWAFVGDGETDEVDTLGAIGVASREKLDNLIFVVNCNLQRLDGPVRGNKRIIDELEGVFRGAGWNVIKVIWGSDWDELFERDHTGPAAEAHGRVRRRRLPGLQGQGRRLPPQGVLRQVSRAAGAGQRHDRRADLDRCIAAATIRAKIYNAYKRAMEHKGGPTVILAKTVKGYGLGTAQARNATHQEKKLTDDGLAAFVKQFDIPIPEDAGQREQALSPVAGQPRDRVHAGAARRAGRLHADARGSRAQLQGAGAGLLRGVDRGLKGPRSLDHHGLRQHPAPPA